MAVAEGARTGVKVITSADGTSVGSAPSDPDLYWLWYLQQQLVARQVDVDLYEAYYDGNHRLGFATPKFREAFGNLFGAFSDNWCALVSDASVERLNVQGFRFGDDGPTGDADAWDMWQANGLDAQSIIAHTTAVVCQTSYLLAAPGGEGQPPAITVEHPCEVIVACAPGTRTRVAALKRWQDPQTLLWHALIYTPETIYAYVSDRPQRQATARAGMWLDDVSWFAGDLSSAGNPVGVVPVVPLTNDPDARGVGRSDIAQVIPTQDAVNKILTDMIVASEFAAFPQRWATGIEIPRDEAGNALPSDWRSAVSRIWMNESNESRYGQFDAADLGNYVKAVETLVQHIAARTRTPPHYLLGQSGSFPSGDSLKATETGLVAKVRRKQVFFGEAWEETMRLAFKIAGNAERAADMGAETLWRDPESRSQGELVDSLVKLATIGVPAEMLWERAGFSPQQIARIKAIYAENLPAVQMLQPATGAKNPNAQLETGVPGADPAIGSAV